MIEKIPLGGNMKKAIQIAYDENFETEKELDGEAFDLLAAIEKIKLTDGAKFFDESRNDVFPREDFFLCTDADKFDFVLRLERPENSLPYMTAVK